MSPSLESVYDALMRLLRSGQFDIQPVPTTGLSSETAPLAAPSPCQMVDPKAKGYHLEARVHRDQLVPAAKLLDEQGFAIDTVTGVDWLSTNEMEIVYDFFHPATWLRIVLRVRAPRNQTEVPSIISVFPGANWHERETHEFFGIRFLGHPNLTPFLLPEDATYHPLRKDFAGAN